MSRRTGNRNHRNHESFVVASISLLAQAKPSMNLTDDANGRVAQGSASLPVPAYPCSGSRWSCIREIMEQWRDGGGAQTGGWNTDKEYRRKDDDLTVERSTFDTSSLFHYHLIWLLGS